LEPTPYRHGGHLKSLSDLLGAFPALIESNDFRSQFQLLFVATKVATSYSGCTKQSLVCWEDVAEHSVQRTVKLPRDDRDVPLGVLVLLPPSTFPRQDVMFLGDAIPLRKIHVKIDEIAIRVCLVLSCAFQKKFFVDSVLGGVHINSLAFLSISVLLVIIVSLN
jgi:hypothetical protein